MIAAIHRGSGTLKERARNRSVSIMATAQLDTLLRHLHNLAAGPCVAQGTDRQLLDGFTAHRDETAFATLVARHGPMVLRVCRRVLNHEQDAEAAFQATFLVLAKNTAGNRRSEALAGWLHGVAYRTALKAKRSAARRRNHEARVQSPAAPKADPTWKEVRSVLDEEIQRLPSHYRSVFTLCVLEGKSIPEAATELGCKLGTVSSRLTRARRRLQQRLAQRGLELAALLAALSVAESGQAEVPAALAQATIRLGLWVAAGEAAAETIPSHIAQLATGVTRALLLTKTGTIATALLLPLVLLASAGLRAPQEVAARERPVKNQKPDISDAKEQAKPARVDRKGDSVEASGQVVAPDGKPVAGAKLFLRIRDPWDKNLPVRATSDKGGKFDFTFKRSELEADGNAGPWYQLIATAEGYAPDWSYGANPGA